MGLKTNCMVPMSMCSSLVRKEVHWTTRGGTLPRSPTKVLNSGSEQRKSIGNNITVAGVSNDTWRNLSLAASGGHMICDWYGSNHVYFHIDNNKKYFFPSIYRYL